MAYPSLEKYNEAFQQHSVLLADAELKAGTVATTGLGLPLAISGGFALTYTINSGGKKFAVRCFHRESKALEKRYVAIAKRITSLKSPYFLDFKFQQSGIRIDGRGYPIVKMAWAKGETLGEFLETNRTNSLALQKLSHAIESMATFLEKENIAHGDLQTGNLMISGGGSSVQLIDYDGMYVDDIKDIGSAELGHVNFQHPSRKGSNPFGPTLDRFSLIALSIALKALRSDSSLWQKTNAEADAILFRANDFNDPASSQTFALLSKNAALATDIRNFASVCKSPMDKTPSLIDFLAGRQIPTTLVTLGRGSKQRAGYIGAYAVLSATNYEVCLRHVGDKVEVIGKIFAVKEGLARNRKPYIFINFADWRGQIFKISIWSEGLAILKERPDSTWVEKWISVIGLMEPPYEKPKYQHLSINVTALSQMTFIAEADANWRLAGPSKGSTFPTPTPNAPQPPLGPDTSTVPSVDTGNADILIKIREIGSQTQSGQSSRTQGSPVQNPTPNAPQPPLHKPQNSKESGIIEKFCKWFFG